MAYGVLCFTIPRQADSEALVKAEGLPCTAATWKGMGSTGDNKPRSFAITLSLGYLLLFLGVFLMTVESLPQGEDCHVERCTNDYRKIQPDLDIADQTELVDTQTVCDALRTYRHCINKTVGCHGNIFYYYIRNFVRQKMETYNCSMNGYAVEVAPESSTGIKPRKIDIPAVCLYQGKNTFSHCGLFGDPHLRTFYGLFQTCRIKGAWPLINNDYLTVQVTNDAVPGSTDATATSKLTVIVKGNVECTSAEFETYQAQTNSLPGTFDDGRVSVGPYNSLELVEVDPGRHVEIHIRYINTVVIVRQIGPYFTFSIKMPEDLVNQSSLGQDLQLCVRGCPQAELVNYQEYLATRKYTPSPQDSVSVQVGLQLDPAFTRSEAEKRCRDAQLSDFYFDSCVFDLIATGDQNFTLSALVSWMDAIKLQPGVARGMDNRTTLDSYDELYGKNSVSICRRKIPHQIVFLVILTLLVSVLCSR